MLTEEMTNQQPGESLKDWRYRLVLAKARKEVDLSWCAVRDKLGLDCSPEYLRKVAFGIAKYDKYLKDRRANEELDSTEAAEFTELENKGFWLQREKQKMQDQRRMLRKDLREWARADHLKEEIIKAVKELEPLQFHKFKPTRGMYHTYGQEAVLLLSDWHIGMVTDNVVNIYNEIEFSKRVGQLTHNVAKICMEHNITTIPVFGLGAFINGLIHVTTRINNEEDVIRQTMRAADMLAEMLGTFSEGMSVKFYWSRGNHDRVTANKKESVCRESFADIILWYLQARLEGCGDIEFMENEIKDDEIIVTHICEQTIFAVHGHKDKPAKAVQNLSLMLKIFPDYVFMGHYHAAAEREIQGAEVIINGSLCGTDNYAKDLRRTSHPSQKLMLFDEDGRVCTYNIRLDKKEKK